MVDLFGLVIQALKWVVLGLLIAGIIAAFVKLLVLFGEPWAVIDDLGNGSWGGQTPRQLFAGISASVGGVSDPARWIIGMCALIPAFWVAEWFWRGIREFIKS